jgi:hypothetical protein
MFLKMEILPTPAKQPYFLDQWEEVQPRTIDTLMIIGEL